MSWCVAGSEGGQDQDSLDGQLPSVTVGQPAQPPAQPAKQVQNKTKRARRPTAGNQPSSSESGDEATSPAKQTTNQNSAQSKPGALKTTMDRANSNFSHKSGQSKSGSKSGASRPGTAATKASFRFRPLTLMNILHLNLLY